MLQDLNSELRAHLEHATRIAVLGVGSEIRGDDAAGLHVIELLQQQTGRDGNRLGLFYGSTAPENLTGAIRRFKPSHLIMVDVADVGREPGDIEIISPERITGVTGLTHSLSLRVFADYMHKSIGCKVIVVGIQPKSLEYNAALTPEVQHSAERLAEAVAATANSLDFAEL